MSFSETTQIREPTAEPEPDDGIRKFSTTSSGDEAFEKLEIKRRLTIVSPPGTFLGDEDQDDENLDIAYDDELIYDDEDPEQDLEGDEYYERYSDEEEVSEQVDDHLIAEPKTLEDLNALYQPKFEEKFTTIESRFQAPREMLPAQSQRPITPPLNRSSPQPPPQQQQESMVPITNVPVMEKKSSPILPVPSPLDPRKSSPVPTEIKPAIGTVLAAPPGHADEEYDDEEEYSDELYEEEEESDVDDDDLMRRLEAKYGKLPQQLEGEEGDEDFLGESDLEEEEDDDDDPSWTSKVK